MYVCMYVCVSSLTHSCTIKVYLPLDLHSFLRQVFALHILSRFSHNSPNPPIHSDSFVAEHHEQREVAQEGRAAETTQEGKLDLESIILYCGLLIISFFQQFLTPFAHSSHIFIFDMTGRCEAQGRGRGEDGRSTQGDTEEALPQDGTRAEASTVKQGQRCWQASQVRRWQR